MTPSPAQPLFRLLLTVTASLALAVLLAVAALGALLLVESARVGDPALVWAVGFGVGALGLAFTGGFYLGRHRPAGRLSLFVGGPTAGLVAAHDDLRNKLAEAGGLLRDARREGASRNQSALALRQALDRAVAHPSPATESPSVQQTLRSLAGHAERTAGAAQEERLALLRLSRVLLEATLALHRARGFARTGSRSGLEEVRPQPPRSWVRPPRRRAVRELLAFLDHRYREQADRN